MNLVVSGHQIPSNLVVSDHIRFITFLLYFFCYFICLIASKLTTIPLDLITHTEDHRARKGHCRRKYERWRR